jgi:hypothetical protein
MTISTQNHLLFLVGPGRAASDGHDDVKEDGAGGKAAEESDPVKHVEKSKNPKPALPTFKYTVLTKEHRTALLYALCGDQGMCPKFLLHFQVFSLEESGPL